MKVRKVIVESLELKKIYTQEYIEDVLLAYRGFSLLNYSWLDPFIRIVKNGKVFHFQYEVYTNQHRFYKLEYVYDYVPQEDKEWVVP